MTLILAIVGAVLGLFAVAAAFLTAWYIMDRTKQKAAQEGRSFDPMDVAGGLLNRWSLMDYALLLLFLIGTLLLTADAVAVLRDREAFPPYHAPYLISGLLFMLMGMTFMVVRLALVLRTLHIRGRYAAVTPQHHHEPNHTDHAEQRVQGRQQAAEPYLADQVRRD
jgi:hypothetical protein